MNKLWYVTELNFQIDVHIKLGEIWYIRPLSQTRDLELGRNRLINIA
jgi:hypothetical protein